MSSPVWVSMSAIDRDCVAMGCRTIDGMVWGLSLSGTDGSHGRTSHEIVDGPVRGQIDVRPSGGSLGERLLVEGLLQVYEPLVWLSPMMVPLRARGGWLLLAGREAPMDLADARLTTESHALPLRQPGAFAWRSQEGFVVRDRGGSRMFDATHTQRLDEKHWRAGLVWGGLKPGQDVAVAVERRAVAFLSDWRLDRVLKTIDGQSRQEPPMRNTAAGETAIEGMSSVDVGIAGMKLTVRVREQPASPSRRTTMRAMRVQVTEDADQHRVTVLVTRGEEEWQPMRMEAELTTRIGNPTWDGSTTVVIPGNFARTNYHPDHVHGGGPKYGPDPFPKEREANTANDDAPGRAHGWTFAASRLPQVWAFAGDAESCETAWLGTSPRSALGETCAGFVSPTGEVTRLRLTTPTTYEPWVPLGYSRMRSEARRDFTLPPDTASTIAWEFVVRAQESADLNAWGEWDRQLYLDTRDAEPRPVRPSMEDAARICARALHEKFTDTERALIVYSTGPQGRQALVGFTGMAHSALVMMWAGSEFGEEAWVTAGRRVLDTVAAMFLSGPQFPWTCIDAEGRGEGGTPFRHGSGEPGYVVMCAFDSLAEALRRERALGRDHEAWERALCRCADAWVDTQSAEGRFAHWGPGYAKDFPENDYETTNVEAGVMANLVDAWELFGEQRYLESAKRAAVPYGKDLEEGRLYGGPGDIRSLVNSEVPMFFLRGFRRLWEATGDPTHRRAMVTSAHWRAQFQYAHSWVCDSDSPLFRSGWSGLGGESASACNLHMVAFGCINIPDYQVVASATNDPYWQERLEDLAGYATQQYAHFAGDLGFPFAGAGTESWWATDTLWGKGHPHIFTEPGFDLGFMSWVTGWSGYGALSAREAGLK